MPAAAATARIESSVARMTQRDIRRSAAGRARRSYRRSPGKTEIVRAATAIRLTQNRIKSPRGLWRGLEACHPRGTIYGGDCGRLANHTNVFLAFSNRFRERPSVPLIRANSER